MPLSPKKSNSIFAEIEKSILKVIWNLKGPTIAKTILEENKVGELTLPNFKTYCKAIVINTLWYRDIEQTDRTERRETNLHVYDQMIVLQGAKTTP